MSNDLHERFSLLAIQKILYLYPRIAHRLYLAAGSAAALFDGDRGRFREYFGNFECRWNAYRTFNDWRGIERDWERISRAGVFVMSLADEEYPALLKEIYDPPLVLMARGAGRELLHAPSVGVVGARKAGESGRRLAAQIAEDLSERGFCVTSGMAYGIDSAAHLGALRGGGNTIAVFGCGIQNIYPSAHRDLARRIEETGILLSEFPFDTGPFPSHFPQRNRIISGMSLAVVVVEAAKKSGSLITAKLALEQGRDVYAVPGTGARPSVQGSNQLIRDGAMLVENGDEVAELLEKELPKWPFLKKPGHFGVDMGKDSELLGSFPARGEISIDDVVSRTGMSAAEVLSELTKLVLGGTVEERPGRRFRLKGE